METQQSTCRVFADGHHEMMEGYIFDFLKNEPDVLRGNYCAFDSFYLPIFKKSGVNLVSMAISNEHVTQVMYSNTDRYFLWDALKKLDILHTELEQGCRSFMLIKTGKDIDTALENGKIGIICIMNGGIALQGKQCYNTLSSLRSLYRHGLRSVQLTTNSRNRLGDGVAQSISEGRLTGFGIEVVEECGRLGILLDTAQISDFGFFDLIARTQKPVIDSHSGCKSVCDFVRNISDERIKAIAKKGGLVEVPFWAAPVANEKETPDISDLLRHTDHIINIAGADHVGLGPEFCAFETPTDRVALQGFSHLGPDFCPMDYQTPAQSEKYPGWVDGVWYGKRKDDFIAGAGNHWEYGNIIPALEKHGYSDGVIEKILGKNLVRVYKEVI